MKSLGVVVASAVAACVTPMESTCADGVLCGSAQVCAPLGGGCVDPAQVEACLGLVDGAVCDLAGVGAGRCRDQVCVVTGCGDGVIDAGEACDDGESNGPDGACTATCRRPTCGDGELQGDEACDDGAGNGDDRPCLLTCVVATCGDGRVRAGEEACDAGAGNADDGACTTTCTSAGCGDGHVWAGVETCDDGNLASGDGCRADCQKIEACGDAIADLGEACDDGNTNTADGCDACVVTTWLAEALLAGAPRALDEALGAPRGVAVDRAGNVFVADSATHRVWRLDSATAAITVVAGRGVSGAAGDGGPATAALLASPEGLAVDGLGNVYIADTGNHRVRVVDAASGTITTLAGIGAPGFLGDGGAATQARLSSPFAVAVDGLGDVYIADFNNSRVRHVERSTGRIDTVAGNGQQGLAGDGGPATAARVPHPVAVALDPAGNLFIADPDNTRVRRVDAASGTITTLASAGLSRPGGLAALPSGDVIVADEWAHRVLHVDGVTGAVSVVAGTGASAYAGDGGPALAAALKGPAGVAVDRAGNVFDAELGSRRIRRVDAATGVITTVAGSGATSTSRAGGAATASTLSLPRGVDVDAVGNVYFGDYGNSRVWRIDATSGALSIVAGTGASGFSGDGGAGAMAALAQPEGLAVDDAGNVYIADSFNNRIRRVDAATGVITTVAGRAGAGFAGDGGPATAATLFLPFDVAVASDGTLYIADEYNHRIRRVDPLSGVISTVAGTGSVGFAGDGGPATAAALAYPRSLAVDSADRLVVADAGNVRLRRIDPTNGLIDTVVGTGVSSPGGDGGLASATAVTSIDDVAFDADDNLYLADGAARIRRVDATSGVIATVAGTGTPGVSGDGGPALAAQLQFPMGVAVDGAGRVAIADMSGQRIRLVDTAGRITTVGGQVDPAGAGPAAAATLADPQALVVAVPFTLIASGSHGVVEALAADGGALAVVAGRYPQAAAMGDLARYRAASFGDVDGVAFDAAAGAHGVIYLSETTASRVHAVTIVEPEDPSTWTIAALGAGGAGFVDGALATAQFRAPRGLWLDDATHTLFVADAGNHVVRAIDLDAAMVRTVAGRPATLGYFGDDGAATDALLYAPSALALAPNGDLFIADTGNHRIRRVASGSGVITTVLGDGVAASSGEGGPAWTFPVDTPRGLAFDAQGNLMVTSSTAVRLLPADGDGVVDGNGAVQTIYGAAPRDTFPALATGCLTGIAVIDATTVHVADACSGLLVELWRQPA